MVAALFDSNIVIDHLKGYEKATAEIAKYDRRSISIITWIEVMSGAQAKDEAATSSVLAAFSIVPLDEKIAARAVELRRVYRVKLPDAVIWASAQTLGRLLVTRDVKDFPANDPGIRVPYKLS
jgi:predicted nucleic acid-binding protein